MMIRYDKPIIKTAAEMKPGDIFRTEYGNYGNWCEFVFESCNAHLFDVTETHFHRKGHTQSETCYSMTNIHKVVYEVVGREKKSSPKGAKQIFTQDQYNTGRRKSQYEYQRKTYSRADKRKARQA